MDDYGGYGIQIKYTMNKFFRYHIYSYKIFSYKINLFYIILIFIYYILNEKIFYNLYVAKL